jgi:thioredoxin reductase
MSSDRTLLVVGGGPAGVTAALQASFPQVWSYLGPED